MQVFQNIRRTLTALLPALLLLPAGCAKAPSGSTGTSPASGPQLIVTMTVAGTINPNDYYYVLFNVNNTPNASSSVTGPIPVVAPPYGNGFAAGAFSNYVEYHAGQPGGTNFGYYTIDPKLQVPSYLGSTGYLVQSQAGGNTLTFQLPLANLATANITADQINDLEINFVATNVVPVTGDNLNQNKIFDALYAPTQAGNSYVTLLTRTANGTIQPGIYQNRDRNIESNGDVAQYVNGIPIIVTAQQSPNASDLDIIDFSVQLNGQ